MVTIRDVARNAGVSVASASRALNDRDNVTAATRDRVRAAAQRLSYVPHSGARNLTRQKTDSIGVVLPDLFGEFFSELVRGMDRVAYAHGLQLLLSNMHGNPHEAITAVRAMRGRVDGVLVMVPDAQDERLLADLGPAVPSVLLNSHHQNPGFASVGIDNQGGAQEMTNFLIARGYRRIAFVSGPRNNRDSAARQAGFVAALAAASGERSPVIIAGDFSEASGAEAAKLLIAGRMPVDAIFCANDMMAIGCCGVLADAGIKVGPEIGVAGFDDIPIAHYTAPALTTMNARIAELGAAAAEMLIKLIEDPQIPRGAMILPPQLIARQSTARRGAPQAGKTYSTYARGVDHD